MKKNVAIENKAFLTLEEAAAFYNIGIHSLRSICDGDAAYMVLWVGNKRLIPREQFMEFLTGYQGVQGGGSNEAE
ncbi:MAG: helix-turn-helix domain-containing protein [Lachnospiraceae bacterium]|nr:helix-turn-helix domain-containing protein [Lachnospiraceae bacterium]